MACLPLEDDSAMWLSSSDADPVPDPSAAPDSEQDAGWAVIEHMGSDPNEGFGQELMSFLTDFHAARSDAQEPVAAKRPGAGRSRRGANQWDTDSSEARDPYEGSEVQEGPGWWYATDGRWYPPELHPDARSQAQ